MSRPQTHTINQDAREFGLHMRQGGWRLGLLVARNVVVAPGRVAPETLLPKVNATHFAKIAGTSNDRVLRHLAAWERAANAGLVPHSASLTPGSDVDLDVERLPAWGPIYNAPPERTRPAPARTTRPAPGPVTTRTVDVVVPPPTPVTHEVDPEDAHVNRAIEAANQRMAAELEAIRNGTSNDLGTVSMIGRTANPVESRNAEWAEDVRYAVNAIMGHTRRLFDAARDEEWSDPVARRRAAQDLLGLSKQLAVISEIAADPSKGSVSDNDLQALLNS
jgi:hypothetical protein